MRPRAVVAKCTFNQQFNWYNWGLAPQLAERKKGDLRGLVLISGKLRPMGLANVDSALLLLGQCRTLSAAIYIYIYILVLPRRTDHQESIR